MREHVAWVTLNRPRSLNALSIDLGRELLEAFGRLADDPAVRAVVLTGAGRDFCSGIDLRELAPLSGAQGRARGVLEEIFHPLVLAIRRADIPVIAAVNGIALGLGASIALACDVVVAAQSASFHVAFANLGLGVDGGTSALLTARVGFTRATQLALLAEPVSATQAVDWGLINAVVADEELHSAVATLGRRLASSSAGAMAAIKRAVNAAAFPQLESILALEAGLQQERADSADVAEAARAFLEKRAPVFSEGRPPRI